jgi:phosphatidylserine/phosphatidylglycerophosphate/cardiolipin synthase-like enzyme
VNSTPDPLREALERLSEADGDEAELRSALLAELAANGAEAVSRKLARELRRVGQRTDRVSLIVTGLAWLGGGTQAIEGRLIELIESARRELALVIYSMTSGPARVWNALERAVDGGVRCTLVVDRLNTQDEQMYERFRRLRNRHVAAFDVFDFIGEDDNDHLHAKIVVSDRHRALVGSANLTAHGLLLAHELAVLVEGPAAEEIATRIELLTRSRLVKRPE